MFLGNPSEEIVSYKVPGLLRGREPVLSCLENRARMKKKKKCRGMYQPLFANSLTLVLGALGSCGLYSN